MRYLVLILIFSLSNKALAAYVNDLSDFKLHCNLHRDRVIVLGGLLRSTFYPEVDVRLLENYLRLHDAAKVSNEPNVYTNYGFEAPPFEILFAHYGREFQRDKNERMLDMVKLLSMFDEEIRLVFFHAFGSTHAQELREIETIADLVDRGLDPVATEEFGRPMRKASEFFMDGHLVRKALWLEEAYPRVTAKLTFEYVKVEACEQSLIKPFQSP